MWPPSAPRLDIDSCFRLGPDPHASSQAALVHSTYPARTAGDPPVNRNRSPFQRNSRQAPRVPVIPAAVGARPARYGAAMAAGEYDTIVVGAGIVGLTTALLLAEAGRRIAVVTAEPVGGGSTGRSACIVSRLHGTAYRRMLQETAPKNAAAHEAANEAGFEWL